MAEKDFETDDPMEFMAIRFPATPGFDSDEAMARTVIEEYALLGMGRDRVRQLFRSPAFAGPHRIWIERGEGFVDELLGDVFGPVPAKEVH